MADENRWRDEDRNRQQDDGGRGGWGWGSSGGMSGQDRSFGQQGGYGGDRSYGQQGGYGGDRSYGQQGSSEGFGQGSMGSGQHDYGRGYGGQAGGFQGGSQGFGQQSQGFSGGYGQQGQSYGQAGGYAGQSSGFYGGSQTGFSQGGFGQGGQSGGAYTGQTGTGYGHTYGGQGGQDRGGQRHNWLERAKDSMSALFSGDDVPGAHRGKGPKSYSRSDARVLEDINDRLTDDPFLDASDIEVTVEKGEVTLAGQVAAREDKRRAEDLAENVSGVKHVQNNLRVRDSGGLFSMDRQAGTGPKS